jgi:D-glycero-alpha-D-manno-heptose-7-phosphate kinase
VNKVRARAPLRLGFAGGGTDVAPYCDTIGLRVLNAMIGMFAHSSIAVQSDQKVKFVALDYEQD